MQVVAKRDGKRRPHALSLALGVLAIWRFCFRENGFEAFSMTSLSAPVRGARSSLKLAKDPTQASIKALEATTPQCLVSSIRDLEGTWHVSSPKDNAPKGLMHGDVPRMLLNLYTGDIGRMLSMDVVAAPMLRISADGRTSTETKLRWGRQEDHITLQGKLELVGTNILREKPKATRSDALKLTLPAMQQDREMKITYFDGNVLVLRDSRGIVDVLWREDEIVEPEEDEYEAWQAEGTAAPSTPVNQVESLLENVKRLAGSLEDLRNQSKRDAEVRQKLSGEVGRLEKELDTVTAGARADSVTVKAIEQLGEKVSEIFETQKDKTDEKTHDYESVQMEMEGLKSKAEEMQGNISMFRVREEILLQEMAVLQQQRAGVGRSEEANAYRAAMDKAHEELRTVRSELRASTKEVSRLTQMLRDKGVQLQRLQKAMDSEVAERKRMQDQLSVQQQGYKEANQRLAEASAVEAALWQELANVRTELEALEERKVRSKEMATDIEDEMKNLAEQVGEAKKTIKTLGDKKKRRFWPFR